MFGGALHEKSLIGLLLCAPSVFSVPLWLFLLSNSEPQRHREHRGGTRNISLLLVCLLLLSDACSQQSVDRNNLTVSTDNANANASATPAASPTPSETSTTYESTTTQGSDRVVHGRTNWRRWLGYTALRYKRVCRSKCVSNKAGLIHSTMFLSMRRSGISHMMAITT
jgi:hypothetical protein